MTETTRRSLSNRAFAGVAAAAVVVAGLGVLYVTGAGSGNPADAACAPALQTAARLAPLSKGEVAAFQRAEKPLSLATLAFKDPAGHDVKLASFAGRAVLLNLWATWCGPCRAEMPTLDRLQAERNGPDFTVLAVNLDTQGLEKPAAFLKDTGVTSLALYADQTTGIFGELRKHGLALGLPTTVLIDGKACQLGVMSGPAEWDSKDAKALIDAARAG